MPWISKRELENLKDRIYRLERDVEYYVDGSHRMRINDVVKMLYRHIGCDIKRQYVSPYKIECKDK